MPVRQGFNAQEGSPEMGRFTVRLKPDAPPGWRQSACATELGWHFDTIAITPTRFRDPSVTRPTILAASVFSGYVEDAEAGAMAEPWSIAGPSLVSWLGTGDSPSAGPTGFSSAGSVSLASFLASLFGGGTPAGKYVNGLQLYSASTCSTNTITDTATGTETARQLIDRWCRQTTNPTEWWVRPDGQAHFAKQGNAAIFAQTPSVLVGRGIESGVLGGYVCFRGNAEVKHSVKGWCQEVVCDDGSEWGFSYGAGGRGTFDPSIQMEDGLGSLFLDTATGGGFGVYYKVTDGIGTSASYEANHLLQYRHHNSTTTGEDRRERRVEVDAFCLAQHVIPGDHIYLYDPDTYAVDTDNELAVNGKLLYPRVVRVFGMDWPIKPGMGVYRISNGSGDPLDGSGAGSDYDTVTDLSDHVLYEDGPTRLDINAVPVSLRQMAHTFTKPNNDAASWR